MAYAAYTMPRPDRVTRTGVIEPYPIRQRSPVRYARKTIVPFINAIRPTRAVMFDRYNRMLAAKKVIDELGRAPKQRVLRAGPNLYMLTPLNQAAQSGSITPTAVNLLDAMYARERAYNWGTTGQLIRAKQSMVRALRRF